MAPLATKNTTTTHAADWPDMVLPSSPPEMMEDYKWAVKMTLAYFNHGNGRAVYRIQKQAGRWAQVYFDGDVSGRARAVGLLKLYPDLFNLEVASHSRLRLRPAAAAAADSETAESTRNWYMEPTLLGDRELDALLDAVSDPAGPAAEAVALAGPLLAYLPEFLAQLATADFAFEAAIARGRVPDPDVEAEPPPGLVLPTPPLSPESPPPRNRRESIVVATPPPPQRRIRIRIINWPPATAATNSNNTAVGVSTDEAWDSAVGTGSNTPRRGEEDNNNNDDDNEEKPSVPLPPVTPARSMIVRIRVPEHMRSKRKREEQPEAERPEEGREEGSEPARKRVRIKVVRKHA